MMDAILNYRLGRYLMMSLETKFLIPGMQIAQSIMTPSGQLFLKPGATLKLEHIKLFSLWGIASVNVVLPARFNPARLDSLLPYQETFESVVTAFERVWMLTEYAVNEFRELSGVCIELMIDMDGVVNHLSQLRAYNEYTFLHSLNVAIISGLIGREIGYTGAALKDLILAGLLHDIGKIRIPPEIINKPGKLTVDEMDVVKKHSLHGYELLNELEHIAYETKMGILQHHERLDGSGYPFGLRKNRISLFARIVAIADMYDAMTSERVYRRRMSPCSAVETILGDMHHKLDPNICIVFLKKIRDYFTGKSDLFNNGPDTSHSIPGQSVATDCH
jgi:HD-GYP domain-containing protein (c-di-GMP phosphodiesterase class II)